MKRQPRQNASLAFQQGQDRSFFNIYKPVEFAYNEGLIKFNDPAGPLEPSEANRQTGAGKKKQDGGKIKLNDLSSMIPAKLVRTPKPAVPPPFIHRAHYGTGLANRPVPTYVQMLAQPDPAINNWKPGTRIPEPIAMYQDRQMFRTMPVPIPKPRAAFNHSILSSDDFKPYSETQKYYGQYQFMPGK
jgi:hypothetical protein